MSEQSPILTTVTDAELAELDAIIFYYAAADFPRYTDEERRSEVAWSGSLTQAQSRALERHQARTRRPSERGGTVDAAGLNPAAEVRAGSSPAARTNEAEDVQI